jgi:hypothetical protein
MSEETSTVTEGRELQFGTQNALFAVAAAATIGLGYWLLSQGSITAAPILLVIGYVVLAPLAILR